MLKNFDIETIDENEFAQHLEQSGRADNVAARQALCIKIGVEYRDMNWVESSSAHDFALQLVKHLKETGNTPALIKLRKAIKYNWFSLPKVLEATLLATVIVLLMRSLGILQPWELKAFDFLMWSRPHENQDSFVSIIGITRGKPISDKDLLELIQKINEDYKPSVIGLDIYRDEPTGAPEDNSKLVDYLKKNQNIVATCLVNPKSTKSDDPPEGDKPPYPEIQEAQLGFTDVVIDEDDVLRRHLFFLNRSKEDPPCNTEFSLSVQLAFNYLESQDPPIKPEPPKKECFKIKNTTFKSLGNRVGGYQKPDQQFTLDAFQMLLNYRSPKSGISTFPTYNDSQVRKKLFKPSKISDLKERVVLIGYTSLDPNKNKEDLHSTPYGYRDSKKMPGVFIQAHMVSQIINAVLKNRPLLSVLPWWVEILWIGGWPLIALIVGIIAWKYCSFLKRQFLVKVAFIFLSLLVGFCRLFLCKLAIWVPLVPPALALILGLFFVWTDLSTIRRSLSKNKP